MPRTAPVPNIPAIPGMNPGVLVKAGGGAGGGSGAGRGKGKGGKKGAGTGQGEENGGDGKKSAADCGKGATGGCTNCTSGASAGDPIDVSDGAVFTTPYIDLLLSGRIDIEFKRKYLTNQRGQDWGLGFGWTHSFAWRLTEKNRSVIVEGPMGSVVEFFFDVNAKVAMGKGGWILAQVSGGYVLDCNDGFEHHFRGIGPSNEPFILTRIAAMNGNMIRIERDRFNRIVEVIDPTLRVIQFEWGRHGRIQGVRVQDPTTGRSITFASYEYDAAGNLVRHTDADGNATHYVYDESHRLVQYTLPTSLSFYFKYDGSDRCVESWGSYPFEDIALDEGLPTHFGLDSNAVVKGIYHVKLQFEDDYTEVLDTQRLRRYTFEDGKICGADSGLGYTSRTFDAAGNMASHTDANGATSHYEYDVRGRLLSETDPLGHRFEFRRDRYGNVTENIDPSGRTIKRYFDQEGNPVELVDQAGAVTKYLYDADGQMTARVDADGSTVEFRSDEHGNLSEVLYPSGERWAYEWDYFGRLVRLTSPVGKVTEFTYTDAGRLVYLRDNLGKEVRATYNGLGDLVSVTTARGTTQFRWGGYRWLAEIVYPNGDVEKARYNHMGWLTRRENELGQSERYHRNLIGEVTSIESFDGSVTEYDYDPMRRVSAERQGATIGTEFERDALGRARKTTYADGTTEEFEYDEHGYLLSATGPYGRTRWTYNDVGLCIEEEHDANGEITVVHNEYDAMRRKVRTWSSLKHSQRFTWENGRRSRVLLDDRWVVDESRDALDRLVLQQLPGGAEVGSSFDEYSRLKRRWVALPPTTSLDVDALKANAKLERWFDYDANDNLIVAASPEGETVRYEYDSRRRLLSKRSNAGVEETFHHDPASNIYETGMLRSGRVYDRGNRLLRRDATSYEYDSSGRLVYKSSTLDDGTVERWEYQWSGRGLLQAVVRPDGRVVRFSYDALERRTQKQLFDSSRPDAALLASTRIVWDGVQVLHEIERTVLVAGEWSVRERTYFYEPGRLGPQGHCEVVEQGGVRSQGEWVFYVGDALETPAIFIAGDGSLRGQLFYSVYGRATASEQSKQTSTARFEGQFEDVETGLFYNYHRYYDPEAGRYISPDPIGTNGLLNLYQYCTNPIGYVDPFGLHELTVQLTRSKEGGRSETYVPGEVDGHRNGRGGGFSSGGMHNGNPKKIPDTGTPGTDTALFGLGKAHTERQALEWAKQAHGDKLAGGQLSMRGQFPPCTACSNAMRQFARNENCEITYEYPTDRKMKYSPKESGPSPEPVSNQPELKELCDSYQSRTRTPKKKEQEGPVERAELGYQTSDTSTNVATKDRKGSSEEMYEKEKNQATPGGKAQEPKEFPKPTAPPSEDSNKATDSEDM